MDKRLYLPKKQRVDQNKTALPIVNISFFNQKKKDDYLFNNFILSDTDQHVQGILFDYPSIINAVVFGVCVKGKGRIGVNLDTFCLEENSVLILLPGSILSFDTERISEDFRMLYLSFTFDFILDFNQSELYDAIKSKPCIEMSKEDIGGLLEIYNRLKEKYETNDIPYKKEIIQYTLLASIYEFSSIYEKYIPLVKEGLNKEMEFQSRFLSLVQANYRTQHHVRFYADKLCLSTKYLSNKIKVLTNKSASDWIEESILLEAKALLKSTDLSIQEIAYNLNYPDASTFGKFFKRQTGMNPGKYRLI